MRTSLSTIAIVGLMASNAMAATPLNVQFANQTGMTDDKVFITVQNRAAGVTDTNITYAGGTKLAFGQTGGTTNIMSSSVSLKTIGKAGLTVNFLDGGIIFVSYGAALTATNGVPSFVGKGGPDYGTRFQSFELTMVGGNGNQGNMTAINYFTAPMGIKSYHGGTGGTLLQSAQYNQDAAAIAKLMGGLTNNNPASVIKNTSGEIIRYIGPSSFGPADTNPFPSFQPYLKAIMAARQTTAIQNHNAFNQPASGGAGSINYDFTLNLKATVAATAIQMEGNITTSVIEYGKPAKPGPTFDNCSVTIDTTNDAALNFVIYGQAINAGTVKFGPGWDKLGAYIKEIKIDNQGALNTTQNLAIGEITSGLVMGFVNSPTVPQGQKVALKDMPSGDWWKLKPVIAFSGVQTNPAFYNQYANVLYNASGNEVYSIPYSDRLGSGPLIDSVLHNNVSVDTWVLTLEPPVPAK